MKSKIAFSGKGAREHSENTALSPFRKKIKNFLTLLRGSPNYIVYGSIVSTARFWLPRNRDKL